MESPKNTQGRHMKSKFGYVTSENFARPLGHRSVTKLYAQGKLKRDTPPVRSAQYRRFGTSPAQFPFPAPTPGTDFKMYSAELDRTTRRTRATDSMPNSQKRANRIQNFAALFQSSASGSSPSCSFTRPIMDGRNALSGSASIL